MRSILTWAGIIACAACTTPSHPNVLLIIVDDLGWADLGVYGSTFHDTPNIDRLAASGVTFTDFYAAGSVCSPTRASIMTGRHPARLHLTNWIGGEQQGRLLQAEYERALPLAERTIAEAFAEAGYATGFVGKWHLGAEGTYPEDQGFEVNVAGHAAGQPGSYFFPYKSASWDYTNVPGLEDGAPGEYLTDRLTDEALGFMSAHTTDPFMLVMSYYTVHTPIESKPDLERAYASKAAAESFTGEVFVPEGAWGTTRIHQNHAAYAGMVRTLDDNVGRLLGALDSLHLGDRTIVVLVSDNGGLSTLANDGRTAPTANTPLRAGKGWLYEGGIRVPAIIRAPGLTPGRLDTPVTTTDLMPTLLDMAHIVTSDTWTDGTSLTPLFNAGSLGRSALYWHFPHYHGSGNRPSGAIRRGNLKLIEWFETGEVELYDLSADLSEVNNLATILPDSTAALSAQLRAWRASVGARMPVPNPAWTVN